MRGIVSCISRFHFSVYESLCPSLLRCSRSVHTTSREKIKQTRCELFTAEQKRQREYIGRIEKIEVRYIGVPKDTTLVMNKCISTPYNCAQHISEMLIQRSALAVIDDIHLWDIHRPIESSCSLGFLHFKDAEPQNVNKAFWRTCSFILGAIIENSFKDNIHLTLHSFPFPNVRSGSFIYDVDIDLEQWQPSKDELRVLSGQMVEFCRQNHKVERLVISADLALDMFKDNVHKTKQIPDIASRSPSGNEVTVYRIGNHIDISKGPLIGNTCFIGRCTIAAVHRIQTSDGSLYRFQGVALPRDFLVNHYAYGILENRAKNLNASWLPSSGNFLPNEAVAA